MTRTLLAVAIAAVLATPVYAGGRVQHRSLYPAPEPVTPVVSEPSAQLELQAVEPTRTMPLASVPPTSTTAASAIASQSEAGSLQAERPVIGPAVDEGTAAPVVEQVWSLEQGETLRQVIERWAAREGFTVAWQASVDFPMVANADIRAVDLRHAIVQVLRPTQDTRTPLVAREKSNRVIVILEMKGAR